MARYTKLIYAVVIFLIFTGGVLAWTGPTTFLFAWVLNLMLMMVIQAAISASRPALASSYYDLKSWENGGEIYKWIGINAFRKLLVLVGWEKYNKHSVPVKKDVTALKHLEYTSRQSELGHLIIFFIIILVAVIVSMSYGIRASISLLFLNIVLNAYPVALQRYNRPRYRRAILNTTRRQTKNALT